MDVRETAREQVTVIGPDARFKGELVVEGVLKVLGSFDGALKAGEVHIGPSAHSNCAIEANTVVVDGKHQGDIVARECLQLTNKANVQGDVTAAELAVAQGATFVGRCVVGPDALSTTRPAAAQSERLAEPKPTITRKPRTGDWMESNGHNGAPQTGDWLATAVPPSR
ncbi:MAG TPA: polymer-forming cytoskeletal protein [Phycisphaerales bacterium]|nr:polymer-forming cytoskeletal protein [Phycisphaerales bacterium]